MTTQGYQDDDDNQNQDEARDKVEEEIAKGSNKLSLENFKLQDLSFMGIQSWDSLTDIDLHKNFLSSIDILNIFRNLKNIRASNNYIQEVNLNLQKLEKLDLQNNYIHLFPLLHQLPRIKVLNLNSNKINDLKVDFKPPSSLSLIELDLGNNLIDLENANDFAMLLEKLKKLKAIKVLNLQNNKNPDEKKFSDIVTALTSLETFNFENAEEYRRIVQEMEKKKDLIKNDKSKNRKQKIDKNNFYFPTMEMLCFNLEAANSHPSFALDHLKDLAYDVEQIQQHIEMVDDYFGKGKDLSEINEMIETFMQNAQLLIDNHFELQSIMLTILSKLSIIKFNDFGIKCFNTLKELMKAGKEMEKNVIRVLQNEVINKLRQQDPEMIPCSLFTGLHELVEETEKSGMLKGLYENCFPSWLRIMVDKIQACEKIGVAFENNEHFDAIVALMAVSVKDCKENVQKAIQKDLISLVADIINKSTWEQNRYIPCLRIVEYISMTAHAATNGQDNAASLFIDKYVHASLLKNIKYEMHIYKKNNDLRDEDSKEDEKTIKLKYLTVAAEIDCLGGLLEAEKSKRELIIKDPVIDEMLSIVSHYKTDPVLLTAICKFARQLFSREELKKNQHALDPKIKKMQSLIQLVPYLGLKKYEEVLRMSRRYYDSSAFAEKEKATQLIHLDDVVVQQLFISIIQLINFFCEEAESRVSPQCFEDVSHSLNENQREAALFNCLEVPNDEVKLAVVECLNNVPLSEFDSEEIATIIRLVGSYKNIGAGKTELVLSKIFWMLTKLVIDKEADAGKNFRLKFGERAVSECMDILVKNLARSVDDEDEEMEKLALSLSLLHFLKFSSANPDMRRYMVGRGGPFQKALYNEQMTTSYEISKVPIELEDTWLGRSIEILTDPINPGADSLDPYNYVSFRLLQRIADVLMNQIELEIMNPFKGGGDVIEKLIDYYKQKLKKRKAAERKFWTDPEENFITDLKANDEVFNIFYQQHNTFTMNNKIQLLRIFLTKKVQVYEQFLKKEFDPDFDKGKLKLKQELMAKKEKSELREIEKEKSGDEEKQKALKKSQGVGGDSDEEEKGANLFKMTLQLEDIGVNYDPVKSTDSLLQNGSSQSGGARSKHQENIKKMDFKVGVQNLKMRSLCVASYLRCLFAAIEYAPDLNLKNEAIRVLKDDFTFRIITQLCDTTGWLSCNIGAKYLRVMRHIVKVPYSIAVEQMENLAQYEMLSIVIKKLLSLISLKIKNEKFSSATQKKDGGDGEEGNALTNEDKVLIFELSATCALLCSQSSLFTWSVMTVKDSGSHSKTRRTPQEKCIDKQISSLFPPSSIGTFIEIIFRDMDLAYKVFESNSQSPKVKESQFIKNKNNMAREYIKIFLGEYLSKCKDNKFEILEHFMKGVVYEKKKLRESYLQEILKSMEDSSYKIALEDYIYSRKYSFDVEEKEKINYFSWVEILQEASKGFQPKLFICTNKGIYIFKASTQKPCSICPPENLCPEGPKFEIKFKYEKVFELFTFPNFIQKVLLNYKMTTGGLIKKEENMSLSIIIPQTTKAIDMISYLKDIMNYQLQESVDQLARGAIYAKIGANEDILYSRYVSYNPKTGLFGFFSEDNLIQNCVFLVLSKTQLFILKENWSKWYYSTEFEKMLDLLDEDAKPDEQEQQMISMAQKMAEKKIKDGVNGFFTELAKYNIADVQNLHVHKGKDSVIEVQFEKKKVEKFIFMCDFARQQFIEALMNAKLDEPEVEPKIKKKGTKMEEANEEEEEKNE